MLVLSSALAHLLITSIYIILFSFLIRSTFFPILYDVHICDVCFCYDVAADAGAVALLFDTPRWLHAYEQSFVEITALTISSAACGYAFGRINCMAGLIFIPYVAWLSFATYLNYTIYKANGDSSSDNRAKKQQIKNE